MNLNPLLAPAANWLHGTAADSAEVVDAVAELNRDPGTVARVVRGRKMRSAAALFDEVGAALQLPPYFGENWDALDECLADLGWLPAERYLVAITDAHQVLDRASPADRRLFWALLERAAGEWAGGNATDPSKRARVFRVVAQAPAGELSRLPVAGQPLPDVMGSRPDGGPDRPASPGAGRAAESNDSRPR